MDKTQDNSIPNSTCTTTTDASEQKEVYDLTQEVDKLTVTQMKRFEVRKMEDVLSIKMLKREYSEIRKTCIFTRKKLAEARKSAATQSDTINQHLQANQAVVENFNKLKNFQTEFILMGISNHEKTLVSCKYKNLELKNMVKVIREKENNLMPLQKEILNKKTKLNNDVQQQIEQKRSVRDGLDEVLIQSNNKIEMLKAQLNQESLDNNLKDLINKKKESIVQLKADGEAHQKQFKQEIDDLMQEKDKKLQDISNMAKQIGEKKELLLKLQSELLSLEKNDSVHNDTFEKAKGKREEISKEVQRKREINALSKKSFDEIIENTRSEQEKIDNELKITKSKFSTNEETLHKEFSDLLAKVEDQKKLIKMLENYQNEIIKLKETKLAKQKEFSGEKDLQEKKKKSEQELKKHEYTLSITKKKQNNFDAKRKELEEKRNNIKENIDKLKTVNNAKNVINMSEKKSTKPVVSGTPKKSNDSTYAETRFKDASSKTSQTPKEVQAVSPDKKSILSFDPSDFDSDEDEYNIKNLAPTKSVGSTGTPRKSPGYNYNWDHAIPSKPDDGRSKDDDLFDRLLSQQPPSKDSNTMDVFKVPNTYATPMRRKSTQQLKKY